MITYRSFVLILFLALCRYGDAAELNLDEKRTLSVAAASASDATVNLHVGEASSWYLRLRSTVTLHMGLAAPNLEVELNGVPVRHVPYDSLPFSLSQNAWGHRPFFLIEGEGPEKELLLLIPLNLCKGTNRLRVYSPSGDRMSQLEWVPALDCVQANVRFGNPVNGRIYFPEEDPQAVLQLACYGNPFVLGERMSGDLRLMFATSRDNGGLRFETTMPTEACEKNDRDAMQFDLIDQGGRIDLEVTDEAFKNGREASVEIKLEYFDCYPRWGSFEVFYDSTSGPKSLIKISFKGQNQWRRLGFTVDDARFSGGLNGADLQIRYDVKEQGPGKVWLRSLSIDSYRRRHQALAKLGQAEPLNLTGACYFQELRRADHDDVWDTTQGLEKQGRRIVQTGLRGRQTIRQSVSSAISEIPLAVPRDRFGTQGMVLVLQDETGRLYAEFLGTVVVAPKRDLSTANPDGYFMATRPHPDLLDGLRRMGMDWMRWPTFWSQFEPQPGKFSWDKLDATMDKARAAKLQVMSFVGDVPIWARPQPEKGVPFKSSLRKNQPVTVGQGTIALDKLPEFENAMVAFFLRYQDVVRACNLMNEPWEGNGHSHQWVGTGKHYRSQMARLRRAVDRVAPDILTVGSDSSYSNLGKFFGYDEQHQDVDVLSTHYEHGNTTLSAALAKSSGKHLWDTESWMPCWMGDGALARRALGYVAVNYSKIGFWSYEWLWERVEEDIAEQHRLASGEPLQESVRLSREPFGIQRSIVGSPNPTVGCTSGLASLINDMRFVKYIHADRPPILMLFRSKDGKRETVAALSTLATTRIHQIPGSVWSQFALDQGGRLQLNDPERRVVLRDLLGNAMASRQGDSLFVPISPDPMFLQASVGILEPMLMTAAAEGMKPVEIVIRDLTQPLDTGPAVRVGVRNALSRPLSGQVTVQGLELEKATLSFDNLQPGELRELPFKAVARPQGQKNRFLLQAVVETDCGRAEISETVYVSTVVRGTPVIDGKGDDWQRMGAIPVLLSGKASGKDLTVEAWFGSGDDEKKAEDLTTQAAFAWDDQFLYVYATVRDRGTELFAPYLSGKNQHELQPAPNDFIYVKKGPHPAEVGDCFILSADKVDRTEQVKKFEFYPPTDPAYRYAVFLPMRYAYHLNATTENDGELLRLRTPDFFWLNCFPLDYAQLAERCRVDGSRVIARRTKTGYVYEAAIPWSELAEIKPQDGGKMRLSFRVKSKDFWVEKVWGERRQNAVRTSHVDGFYNSWAEESEWGFCGERSK